MKKTLLILIFTLFWAHNIRAIYLDVHIFHGQNITESSFAVNSGKYTITADGIALKALLKGEECMMKIRNDSVELLRQGVIIGTYKSIKFQGISFINAFAFMPLSPNLGMRYYDDHLIITGENNKLHIINNVELEHYVAGVVQSESGGSNDNIEYFFVQAIISRTYALVNYLKHKEEGFNLCDGVHCQYYLGRCRNADIARAVARTGGDVIVDKDNRMISAAFHSNCGGETVNSEDIWSIPTSYLKSIPDSFCLHESNATWEYKMKRSEWLDFLKTKYNFPVDDTSMVRKATHFNQPTRMVNFTAEIPLKFIRYDLKLRSTFFSIHPEGDSIIFVGRGYGHGVGLCQQGAINMVKLGYGYKDVIRHFYTDVRIIHYSELKYNFMP